MARQAVVDASVIVKWILDEPESLQALRLGDAHLAGDIQIVVPELAFLEVLNTLRLKGTALSALTSLWNMEFVIAPLSPELLESAVKLAAQHRPTVYDLLYLALSKALYCRLYTYDLQLLKAQDS